MPFLNLGVVPRVGSLSNVFGMAPFFFNGRAEGFGGWRAFPKPRCGYRSLRSICALLCMH